MAIPTLTMIPSGYKAGTLYSVLPTNGDGDFTTSRSSSATRINKSGLIETVLSNVPRLDYSDGSCPSLLLEPQSTNLLSYSEDYSNSSWLKARISYTSIVGQSVISGNTNINNITDSTDNNTHIIYKSYASFNTSLKYTFSTFLKKGSLNYAFLAFADTDERTCIFNLNLGTIHNQGSSIDSAEIENIGNDWYKCSITFTPYLTSLLVRIGTSNGNRVYAGSGSGNIYIDASQLEQQSYPTSYIKTTTSAFTRSVDTCFGSGDINVFNDSEGVLFFKTATRYFGSSYYLSLSNGSTSNRILFRFTSTTQIRLTIISNNSSSVDQYVNVPNITQYNNYAIKYKQNDFALWVNGSEVATDTSGNTPINLSEFAFDSGNGTLPFAGDVKDVRYYNTALTDAELQELTTI